MAVNKLKADVENIPCKRSVCVTLYAKADRVNRRSQSKKKKIDVCGNKSETNDRGLLLTRKLLNQGFLLVKLKSSRRKFYGRHHDLVDRYGISVSQMTTDIFHSS